MSQTIGLQNTADPKHSVLMTALFLILVGLYSATYNGIPTSGDEFAMFDSMSTFVRHGNFLRTIEFNTVLQFQPDGIPALDGKYEPLQLILAAPLMSIARLIPNVGVVHAVWLFNIFVTALTAVLLYVAGVLQGYSRKSSWLTALLFGIATMAWPYSRWFYREPLVGLFILSSYMIAARIIHTRTKSRTAPKYLFFLVLGVTAAILTKQVALLIIPGLLMYLLLQNPKRSNVKTVLILAIVVVVVVLVLGSVLTLDEGRYRWQAWIEGGLASDRWEWMIESFLGYMVSPSRSIWLYSPILLLGVPGAIMIIRRGQFWLIAGPFTALALFGVGYGAWRTWNWWGGWGWGPRYMLPLVPLLMLWVFPAIAWIVDQRRNLFSYLALAILILVGIGIQLLGIAVPYTNYYSELHHSLLSKPNPLQWGRWADFNWSIADTSFAYHVRNLDPDHLDVAWTSANPQWVIPIAAVTVICAGLAIRYIDTRQRLSRFSSYLIPITAILSIGVSAAILFSLKSDPRYIEGNADVKQLVDALNQSAKAEEVVYLDRGEYIPVFMNYYKSSARLITLPYAPGERFGPQEPIVVSDNLVDLAGAESVAALDWAANDQREIWLAASSSPFNTEMLRPIEHYLALKYYPVYEINISQRARTIKFLALSTGIDSVDFAPEYQYGDSLVLKEIRFPLGTQFAAGAVIPVSIVWQTTASLPVDYNVSLFLKNDDGALVAQRDGPPQGTFGYTSHWEPAVDYVDNHGLQMPENLATGDYKLYAVVYSWQDRARLDVRSPEATVAADEALLATITIVD